MSALQMEVEIARYETRFANANCLYMLRLPRIVIGPVECGLPLYKFGVSGKIGARLRTHLKNLQFTDIIFVRSFDTSEQMIAAETLIKRTAESHGERRNIMGNTELIETACIGKYIELIVQHQENNNLLERIKALEDQPKIVVNNNIEVTGDNVIIENKIIVDNKTCEDCGKVFTYTKDLERHKNRKKPCFNNKEIDTNNPNKCEYCNNIFANRCNMLKHSRKCKLRK